MDCCIVGGGPAGMVLGLLLARVGLTVTVLESQPDFDRDFRGDTLHASTLEMLDQIGLAGRVLDIPHVKLREMSITAGDTAFTPRPIRSSPSCPRRTFWHSWPGKARAIRASAA
jgi:2-polyprenyl-6-methoxyphenol hydroxylase-like FAD-dependent oxidoreductase